MRIFDKPVILLTHNDLDGVGSPVVLNALTAKTQDIVQKIYYVNNGDVEAIIEKVMTDNKPEDYILFICDHSPIKETYDKMVAEGVDFYIFDHHKSSQVQDLEYVSFDLNKCGTKLFYEYIMKAHPILRGTILGQFVYHVNDYDMWVHDNPHSKRLNELLYETSIPEFIERFSNNPDPAFTETEELIVSSAEKKRERYINKAEKFVQFHTDHNKNRFGVVFAELHVSELGHELNDRLDLDYIFIVNAQSSKVSLRSKGKVDVAEIAKHFAHLLETNGGGHKAAAGFGYAPEDLPKVFHLLETY